ncbi:MAG TPA: hypothetical protein VH120_21270 [Gemmataceae bacterium]|nr:hypothetical protein [Gemmataceae bacterium]
MSVTRHFVGMMDLGVFVAHFLEIAMFAAAMAALAELGAAETLGGGLDLGRFDAIYYSATIYTTTVGRRCRLCRCGC